MNYDIPKVSVVVPSLNSISYIRECIDSILNQTLKDIEILCIDANSTDGTLEILKNYEKKDKRLRVIISDKKSYGYQMNLGIKEAKGEYLGIVESDDYIKKNMYERLYEVAKKNNCEVVKADFFIFAHGKTEYINVVRNSCVNLYHYKINWRQNIAIFLNSDGINPIGIYRLDLLRINQIRLNETPGASYQDNGLWFQIFAFARSIYFINEAFYMLRRDNPNSSVKSKEKVYCACEEYDFIREFLRKHPEFEKELAPICALHRFGNYMFTLERIDERYKLDFLKRFSQDFRKIIQNGELDEKLFGSGDIKTIYSIVENPQEYDFVYKYPNDIFDKLYFGAAERIKSQLSYRIGKLLINLRNPAYILKFPFELVREIKQYKFEQKIYKAMVKFYPNLKLPCLEEYSDYDSALKVKRHLSYIIGNSFISNPILFLFKIREIYSQYKKHISNLENSIGHLSDYDFLLNRHKEIFNYTPNFKQPITFNEKLIYRILYDRSLVYSFLADKIKMRFYVTNVFLEKCSWNKTDIFDEKSILFKSLDDLEEQIFETNRCPYLPKIYGIYKNIYDIDFEKLPNAFVLKTNHDCGGYVIVENKKEFLRDTVAFSNAMKKLKKHLKWNYYDVFREWHYKDIEPRIFAEELLLGENNKPADTYKFHIFDKENLSNNFIQVTTDRFDNYQRAMFDLSWNLAPFNFIYDNKNLTTIPKKPNLLDSMINISLILAQPFDYVRVDLYQFDEKIYVGELTFTHGAAGEKVIPNEWDKKLGDLWKLKRLSDVAK